MGDSSKHNALLEEGAFPSGVLFLSGGLFERGVLLEEGPFRVGTSLEKGAR